MSEQKKETFSYTYSASRQEELQAIRRKYTPVEEAGEMDKMEQLRRLDQGVTRRGTVVSLCAGILGAMVMGFGMSCVMVWGGTWFAPGILIGMLGMVAVIAAYPLYQQITQKERERIAPRVLRLIEELEETKKIP